MKNFSLILGILLSIGLQAQEVRKQIKEGNKAFAAKAYDEAEIKYREAAALAEEKDLSVSQYNLGDALYKQERYQEAIEAYELSLARTEDPARKAEIYHNLGNSYLKNEQLKEARKNAQVIILASEKEAKEIVALEIDQARKDAASLIDKTNRELEAQKTLALEKLETQVDELSDLIKEKLLGKEVVL